MDKLQEQIDQMSKSIKTDNYPMSIGELAGLYRDGDLNISPIYQRVFRWDIYQQSTLIESILLNIPIPPIYVYQSEDGRWNVIDGQQRLSTIFKFMGLLKNIKSTDDNIGNIFNREPLTKTRFLPALEGKYWEHSDPEKSLTEPQRRYIKRSKILIIIIDKSSDEFAQYEMFQRLNTGGSHLSPQEIRNCILIMKDETAYRKLKELSEYKAFRKALPISEKDVDEQGYIELVVKYFILRYSTFEVSDSENFNEFMTDEIVKLLSSGIINFETEEKIFKDTFDLIESVMGEDAFKKYDKEKNRHNGPVLVGAFEAIIPGIVNNIEYYCKHHEVLKNKINLIYSDAKYIEANKRGMRPISRIKNLAFASKEFMSVKED